jgi:hypothetical protein
MMLLPFCDAGQAKASELALTGNSGHTGVLVFRLPFHPLEK